ncbi:MAG: bifunctional DNA primase/polymerase [Candidatus Sericytochromatia bacterium]
MNGPYAAAAETYWQLGWRGVLPLPERRKACPPKGYTGEHGVDPSYADVRAWADGPEGVGNIALRLPRHVLGVDVDAYADKAGAATLAAAETRWGPLPRTWQATSRDHPNGIKLFAVPEDLAWPGEVGPGTELIQHRHRYAVVWPSEHPEGRTYRWLTPDGIVATIPPSPAELPRLPDAWVEGLTGGEPATSVPRADLTASEVSRWLVKRGAGEPCRRVRSVLERAVVDLCGSGSRHNATRDAVLRIARLTEQKHPGGVAVLTELMPAWLAAATDAARPSPRPKPTAEREWRELVTSAVNLVTANPSPVEGCDCSDPFVPLTGLYGPTVPLAFDRPAALHPAPTPAGDAGEDEGSGGDGPQLSVGVDDVAPRDRTSWWPLDLAEILAGRGGEPPPTHLVRGDGERLFYAGRVNGLLGESESGKSWLALAAVAQVLAAGEPVLYLDFEDVAPAVVARLRALGVTDEQLVAFRYAGPDETLHASAAADLRETLALHRPSVIVVDGVNAAMTLFGLDLHSNGDATRFAQLFLKPLAATGATVIYLDHVPKTKDNRGKGGIGAQAKRAMTTGCALLVEVIEPFARGKSGKLRLLVDKDRPGYVRSVSADASYVGTAVLTSDPATGDVEIVIHAPRAAEEAEADVMAKVCLFLSRQDDVMNQGDIRAAVGGNHKKVDAALNRLVQGHYISESRGRRGAKLYRFLRMYHPVNDLAGDSDDG